MNDGLSSSRAGAVFCLMTSVPERAIRPHIFPPRWSLTPPIGLVRADGMRGTRYAAGFKNQPQGQTGGDSHFMLSVISPNESSIKHYRGIATCYEKTVRNLLVGLHLVRATRLA